MKFAREIKDLTNELTATRFFDYLDAALKPLR
jgi:hypothetical protein